MTIIDYRNKQNKTKRKKKQRVFERHPNIFSSFTNDMVVDKNEKKKKEIDVLRVRDVVKKKK